MAYAGGQMSDRDDGVHPFKAEVQTDSTGKWYTNGVSFETVQAAAEYAVDLSWRWTAVRAWRVNSIGGVVVQYGGGR